jgi:hypothetical protein
MTGTYPTAVANQPPAAMTGWSPRRDPAAPGVRLRAAVGKSLIVGAALLLVLSGCGGASHTKTVVVTATANGTTTSGPILTTLSGSSTVTTTSTSSSTTATSTTNAADVVHIATFKSPTGNIGCMIIADTARCDLKTKSWTLPPRPSNCPDIVDFGQGAIVADGRPGHLVCAGDTTLDPSAKTLAYGTNTSVGGFTCQSRTGGVTCSNDSSGHGFFVSFQTYRTF